MADDTLEITGPMPYDGSLPHDEVKLHNQGYRVGLLDGYKRAIQLIEEIDASTPEGADDDPQMVLVTIAIKTLAGNLRCRMAGVDDGFKIMGGGDDA